MNLLYFFAIPVATILLSIVWQQIVDKPIFVAITTFAIFIVIVYAVDQSLLLLAIIYTLLSFITASLSRFFFNHTCINSTQNTVVPNALQYDEASAKSENTVDNFYQYNQQSYCPNQCRRFYK